MRHNFFVSGEDVEPFFTFIKENKSHPLLWATNENIEDISQNGTFVDMSDTFSDEINVTRFSWETPDFDSGNTVKCEYNYCHKY